MYRPSPACAYEVIRSADDRQPIKSENVLLTAKRGLKPENPSAHSSSKAVQVENNITNGYSVEWRDCFSRPLKLLTHNWPKIMKIAKGDISATGLTVLYSPDLPHAAMVDIVLVHGIQSNPRKAWEYESKKPASPGFVRRSLNYVLSRGNEAQEGDIQKNKAHTNSTQGEEPQNQDVIRKEAKGKEVESKKTQGSGSTIQTLPPTNKSQRIQTSVSECGNKYWPLDFLPDTCPTTRIITWGFDTQVTKGYAAATQHSISSLGKDLLFGLAGDRERNEIQGRPIVFVAHSLGGILVKEALRRSETDKEAECRDVLASTAAVIFLGTPHRGSHAAQLANIVRTVASGMLRLDTNNKVLLSLSRADSFELELGRESFIRLWRDYKFQVKTFQEIKPMTGINIGSLNKLVVPLWSSSLDDPQEHAETIDANHVTMCKFQSMQDNGYKRVSTAVVKFVKNAAKQYSSLNDREKECLASLRFDTLESRQSEVRPATPSTCTWLYNLDNFRKWYDRAGGYKDKVLWIKGKPGSGKSVLIKSLIQHVQNERTSGKTGFMVETEYGRAVSAFFFKGRHQRHYETRPAGLYRTVLYQLFKQDPYLRRRLISAYETKKKYGESWRDDDLERIFVQTYLEEKVEVTLKRCFLFVDAVDECDEDSIRSLVERLSRLAEKSNFSICISSRHYPHISTPNGIEIIVEDHNGTDIIKHIGSNLSGAFPRRDAVIENISNKAAGVFLWVEIVVEHLNSKIDNGEPIRKTLEFLDGIPSEIDSLYKKLLQEIKNEEDNQTAFDIFQWISLAAEPLTLADLRYALAFTGTGTPLSPFWAFRYSSEGSVCREAPMSLREWKDSRDYIEDPEQFLRWLRAHSRGLVEVRSESVDDIACTDLDGHIVQFIHETARTFFLTGNGFGVLKPNNHTNVSTLHLNLLRACLDFISIAELSPTESERILQHQYECQDRIASSLPGARTWARYSLYPFLDYAITYLFYHSVAIIGMGRTLFNDIIMVLSDNDGRIYKIWKYHADNRPSPFSWPIAIDDNRKMVLTEIQSNLDKALQLKPSTIVFKEILSAED